MFSGVSAHAADLTIFGGFQKPGSLTLQSTQDNIPTLFTDPRDFGTFGLRFSGGGVVGGEQTLAYSPNFIESETKAFIFNSNLKIEAPLPKVRPYGTVGITTMFTFGNGIADVGNKLGFNYGGGVKIRPSGPIGVGFEVRGYSIPSYQDQTLKILEASIGVLFFFGG
jgi:hypothetical protein